MPTNYLSRIIQPDVQDYIFNHEAEDERSLVLRQKEVLGVPAAPIAQQLAGRRKSKLKLPTWHRTKGIIYPPGINLEQSSSEATALFKAKIVKPLFTAADSTVGVDLTGGLGVDSFFLSEQFGSFHYVEQNEQLFEIAQHNHLKLGRTHIKHHQLLAEQFLDQIKTLFDLVYIDPSRRDVNTRKVFRLADCLPNISDLQQKIFECSSYLLIKTSPLLDIQQGLREINHVKKVYVVSVENECKELLLLAEKNYVGETSIEAVELSAGGEIRSALLFTLEAEKNAPVFLGEPERYLYEPHASILKAGAFKLISEKLQVKKLSANTHLYTSDRLIPEFPGRIFQIDVLNPQARQLHSLLPNMQVNIATRNYPLSVQELKKTLKLRDGGDKFLFGFSGTKRKYLALCTRITSLG